MTYRFALVPILLLALATSATAAPLEVLTARLASRTATVLSERNGEVLIDAGSKAGVSPLDLFAVATAGTPVIHPQTGAVLGELGETETVLQVTWVKENFSGARRVRGAAPLAAGVQATSFGGLQGDFLACGSDAEGLLAELRRRLPTLRWGEYRRSDGDCAAGAGAGHADLNVLATAERVTVRDAAGNLLVAVERSAAPPPATAVAPTAGAERWYAGDFKGEAAGVVGADFDGDRRQEVAVAGGRQIRLGRIEARSWQELAQLELEKGVRILALDAIDLDGDGRSELCVSAGRDGELSSSILAWRDGRLVELQRQLPFLLRALALKEGPPELYGQELANGQWHGPLRRLVWNGDALAVAEAPRLPAGTGLRGAVEVAAEGGTALLRLGWNDTLEVLDAAGEELWQSSSPYGGSETYLEVAGDVAQGSEHNTRYLYVQQRLQRVAADQVLVPINFGSRRFNRQVSYEESQVQVVRWDGRTLRELWETPKEKGYLADVLWSDIDNDGQAEVVMLVAFAKEGIFSKGRYSLVVLER